MPSSLAGGETLAIDAASGPRQHLEALRRDRSAAPDARPERARVESREGFVDQHQLMVGTVAQGEVPLLGEDLAGRRCLRAIGHLAGRDDGLPDLLDEPGALGDEGRADRVEVGGIHASMVCQPYTPWEYPHEETRMAIEIDPVCGMSVDTTTSQLSLDHDGTTYWFCSKGCLLDFQDDPEKYLDPGYSPSM